MGLVAAGCEEIPPPEPVIPTVTVATPVQKPYTKHEDFTGTLTATETLEVRARVQGYLESVGFEEGKPVEEGQNLFVIEQAPFKARLEEAKAGLEKAQAAMKLAEANLERSKRTFEKGVITKEELQTREAELGVAKAEVAAAEAMVEQAEINVSYTTMKAPFSGLVGKKLVDPGNLVGLGGGTLLATVQKIAPIHAYFDVPERVVVDFLQRKADEGIAEDELPEVTVKLAIGDEGEFTFPGVIDFLDNKVDPDTGTALVRAKFPNEKGLLYPGLFVRIRIEGETDPEALMVDERAVGTDLAGKFVLVVGEDNVVDQRYVKLGGHDGGLRVVLDGLEPDDQYIVEGLQRARPGLAVKPEMATPADSAEGEGPAKEESARE